MPSAEIVSRLLTAIKNHKRNRKLPSFRRPSGEPFPCEFRGAVVRTEDCTTCAGKVELKVYACSVFGECKIAKCSTCGERSEPWPRVFDHYNLWPDAPGLRFNPSLHAYGDGYALAVRTGWKGSEIYVGRLDAKFRPVGDAVKLNLAHPGANFGREDPRLFVHDGALHVAYCGVVGGARLRSTNVLYARLHPDFRVERIFYPKIPGRREWEKNINPFSHDGVLYAVYAVDPVHRILRIDGETATFVSEQPNPTPYAFGERRGGACPVRVGDEYWHFVHSRTERGSVRQYHATLYSFEAKPPFRVTRSIPVPIQSAPLTDKPSDQYCFVVWTGGAVRVGDEWVLANGIHDRWMCLEKYGHDELDARLKAV